MATLAYTPKIEGGPPPDDQLAMVRANPAVPLLTGRVCTLAELLEQSKDGDRVAVASPDVLGGDRWAIAKVLDQLTGVGVVVVTADTGQRIDWTAVSRHTLACFWVAEAALHARRVRLGRRASAKRAGHAPRPLSEPWSVLERDWRDRRWPAESVASRAGLSVRAMYDRFGPRRAK